MVFKKMLSVFQLKFKESFIGVFRSVSEQLSPKDEKMKDALPSAQ